MVSTKVQIIQAVEQMDEDTAFFVWDMILRHFDTPYKKINWDDIEEVEPDEFDIEMLNEIKNNPDCNIFVSSDEMDTRRKLHKQGGDKK